MKMLKSKLLKIKEKEQKDKIEDLKGTQKEITYKVNKIFITS